MNTDMTPIDEPSAMVPLSVRRKTCIATDVCLFELVHPEGQPLPAFDAGAHVTVLTPNGLTRRFSLCNSPREKHRYQIAVKRDAQGQGGSISMVDHVNAGDLLPTSRPLNYFPLEPGAASHLLIAGGIGITPMLAMLRELQHREADFSLVYAARTQASAPFLAELQAPGFEGRISIHLSQSEPTRSLDLEPLLARQAQGQHVYCCGPRRLMQAVREHTRHWRAGSVHFEDFGTSEQAQASQDRPFSVRLVRSGLTLAVPCGVSILEVARRQGLSVPSSCESGTCGTCRTRLVSGVADHRDYVLDEDEHATEIMICVSRAHSDTLEVDL
jgi:phthalate 4,5-dioxygenase reductase component